MDRIFIILLILFVLTGVYAYDRYIYEREEVSPVSKILDLAGLAEFIEWPPRSRVRYREEKITYNMKENLKRLAEKHYAIQDQRMLLIAHRREIIERLLKLNKKIRREAKVFEKVIIAERKEIMKRFPELNEIRKDIIKNKRIKDPEERRQDYERIKEKMLGLLKRVVPDPEKDMPRLKALVKRLEELILENNASLAMECPSVEECIETGVIDIEQELSDYLDQAIEDPLRHIGKILEITRLLSREYFILAENHEANEQQLRQSSVEIDSKLKELTSQLVAIHKEDLVELRLLYDKLLNEQSILQENLEINRMRVRDLHRETNRQFEDIMASIRSNPFVRMPELVQVAREGNQKRVEIFNVFEGNEVQLLNLTNQRIEEDNRVFAQIKADGEGDSKGSAEKLTQFRELVERKNKDLLEQKLTARYQVLNQGTETKHQLRPNENLKLDDRNIEFRTGQPSRLKEIEDDYRRSTTSQDNNLEYHMDRIREKVRDMRP